MATALPSRARLSRALQGAALGLAVLVVPVAHTAPITYDYAGHFTSGPLQGDAFSGWFSFDDSLAQPGGFHIGAGVVSDLAFSFDGVSYDETDSPLAALLFNASGELTNFLFGSHCSSSGPGQFSCEAGASNPGSWFVQHSVVAYAGLVDPELSQATGQPWTRRQSEVPEPGSLALAVTALLPLACVLRLRRRSPGRRTAAAG